ncbi:YbaB/EbfC family DNA-binding protein [Nocardia acidivorans]|uniref:YbaB/EbfC family DNA-binding protein n=1 Tax=Nocardia acidivorans TaxID=404580 RepID=UPI000A7F3D9C|nr:YbaB/EbfC family DNA-binding protein [Nocardia acidivorans]
MARERGEAEAASILEGFSRQMREIAEASRKRTQLTASATSGRVTVTVNADCIVIATKFAADIDEIGYDEIAKSVTIAAQRASADMRRQTEELLRPLSDRRAKMPRLSELFEGMPDLESQAPVIEPASLAPPLAKERLAQKAEPAPEFTDAVDYEDWHSTRDNSGPTSSGW